MLNFQELEVFLLVAENGSFSEAGRLMRLSQPAISKIIKNLESSFNTELFVRYGRGVRLTDAGQTLLPMARELMTGTKRLEESMSMVHGSVVGKLTVCCSTSSGKYLLPGLIARFRQQYPQVHIDVIIRSRDNVMEKLITNQCSFGVSSKKIEHNALEYLPFHSDEVVLIAAADNPWAKFRRVYPDDLLDVPIILREEGSGTHESLIRGLLEHDITEDMLNTVMVLGNAEAIAMAVEEKIGVAFVSRLVAQRGIELGKVVEVEVEGIKLNHQIHFARNLRVPFTRSQAKFWEFVQTCVETDAVVPRPVR